MLKEDSKDCLLFNNPINQFLDSCEKIGGPLEPTPQECLDMNDPCKQFVESACFYSGTVVQTIDASRGRSWTFRVVHGGRPEIVNCLFTAKDLRPLRCQKTHNKILTLLLIVFLSTDITQVICFIAFLSSYSEPLQNFV